MVRLVALFLLGAVATSGFATQKKTEKAQLDVSEQKRQKVDRPAATTRITRNEAFIIATETKLLSEIEKTIGILAKNAARLTQPFLYVIGTSDPLVAEGRGYIFARAKANPKSRYIEVNAGHLDTPDKARDDVVAWRKSL